MYASEQRDVRPRKRSRTSSSTNKEQDHCTRPGGQVHANAPKPIISSDEGSSLASSGSSSASPLQQQQQQDQNPVDSHHLCPMAQWTKLFREQDEEAGCLTETTVEETTTDSDNEAYDDDDDSDYDTDDSEEENRLVKKLVRAAFSPVPMLAQAPKVARMVGKRLTPTEHLKSLVPTARFFNSHRLQDFFEPAVWRSSGEEQEQAYTLEVAQAVRSDDVSTLQRLLLPQQHEQRLQPCGTQSGDSILHLACRHNSAQVLNFLLQKGLSVRYRGDHCGRTPLHEACWSAEEPDWTGVVDKLLDQCPDLLYITDRLGATALDYIAARHHEAACRYLAQRGAEKLSARVLRGEEEGDTSLVVKEAKLIVG